MKKAPFGAFLSYPRHLGSSHIVSQYMYQYILHQRDNCFYLWLYINFIYFLSCMTNKIHTHIHYNHQRISNNGIHFVKFESSHLASNFNAWIKPVTNSKLVFFILDLNQFTRQSNWSVFSNEEKQISALQYQAIYR